MTPSEVDPCRTADTPPAPILGGFGHGVLWSYVTLFSTGAATFFTAGWAVRRVGEAGFGVFALATSLTALLLVVDYTIGLSVMHAGARARSSRDVDERSTEAAVVHTAHGALTVTGLATAVATAGITAVLLVAGFRPVPFTAEAVALLGLATSLVLATSALPSLLVAYQRFSLRAAATVAGVVVRIAVVVLATGPFGLAALGLAQLLGVVTERAVMVVLVRRAVPWFSPAPQLPERASLRQVTTFAGPLFLINISGYMFTLSDLAVIGALVGASAVGMYHVGSLLPVYVVAVLVTGYNVVLPALIASDDHTGQEAATAFLTRVFSYLGGAAFGLAAVLRGDIVELLLGHRSSLAENTLLAFCGIGTANVLVHGCAWLLIARGHHRILARAVAVELPLNLVLTIALVWGLGAVGAAVATMATAAFMDFCVLPAVTRGRFRRSVLDVVLGNGLVPAALGVLVAASVGTASRLIQAPSHRVVAAALMVALAGTALGLVLLEDSGRRTLRQALSRSVPSAGGGPVDAVACR